MIYGDVRVVVLCCTVTTSVVARTKQGPPRGYNFYYITNYGRWLVAMVVASCQSEKRPFAEDLSGGGGLKGRRRT